MCVKIIVINLPEQFRFARNTHSRTHIIFWIRKMERKKRREIGREWERKIERKPGFRAFHARYFLQVLFHNGFYPPWFSPIPKMIDPHNRTFISPLVCRCVCVCMCLCSLSPSVLLGYGGDDRRYRVTFTHLRNKFLRVFSFLLLNLSLSFYMKLCYNIDVHNGLVKVTLFMFWSRWWLLSKEDQGSWWGKRITFIRDTHNKGKGNRHLRAGSKVTFIG